MLLEVQASGALTAVGMVAVPEIGDIQCTPTIAAPEVIKHYLGLSNQAIEEHQISCFAQDMWSLGCILVWLMIGRNAFAVGVKEAAKGGKDVVEIIHTKHNAWVSLLPVVLSKIVFFQEAFL